MMTHLGTLGAVALALALAACGDGGGSPDGGTGGKTSGGSGGKQGGGTGGSSTDGGSSDAAGCTLGADACEWLAQHNAIRCAVNPAAASMPKLVWDDALACVAQQYIDTCPSTHNANRTAMYKTCGGNNDYVGENLAWGYDSIASVVQGWADESAGYDLTANTCSDVCGHYTQIVWASTLRIGCARNSVSCPNWQNRYWVCDYAPGGNINNQRPYTAGNGPNASCQ